MKLTTRLKGVISGGALLNGRELPDVAPETLGAQLMRSIRPLRDKFYNTTRGRLDYPALKDSHEYKDYRLLTKGLRSFDPSVLIGRREKIAFWVNLYNTVGIDGIASLGIRQSVTANNNIMLPTVNTFPAFIVPDDEFHLSRLR